MKSNKRKGIVQELEILLSELREYYGLRQIMITRKLEDHVLDYIRDLQRTLVKKAGKYRKLIAEITKIEKEPIIVSGKEHITDIWLVGLLVNPVKRTPIALNYCIDAVGQAIGRLEDDIEKGIRDEQGNLVEKQHKPSKKPVEDIGESPVQLFDKMQLHPRIRRASKSLFDSGHYAEAIFAAFKAVNNFIKKKTGLSLDGKDLMTKAFNEDKPIIKLNKLSNQSERDEQEGFRFLYMGAMVGIRNPKAHEDIRQIDPYKTLEYLAFASLLIRRAIEGKLETVRSRV